MADAFDGILGQPDVRRFLRATVASGHIGQSYLFTGLAGSNKTQAAWAFAQSMLCPQGGCGTCETCERVRRRRHPDVRSYAPEGAGGYLIEQVREIVADVDLAPIQAQRKVYIIDRADLLGARAANAFLKTLEEPPAHVAFILLGRTRDAMLPTIVSRCQVVPFRHIPTREAAGIVSQNTGVSAERAAIAIQACGGSISGAIEFARSTERFAFRLRVVETMESLALFDDLDVLERVGELLEGAKAPVDLARKSLEDDLAASADVLAAGAVRQIEARNKRQLSARTLAALMQVTAIARAWVRDVMVTCAGAAHLVVNVDREAGVRAAAARTTESRCARAIALVDEADRALAANVSPETCLDVLFMQLRECLFALQAGR